MVFFSAVIPKFFQCRTSVLSEKAAKIGRIIKSKLKSNLFPGNAARIQKLLCLVNYTIPNQLSGSNSGSAFR